MIAQHPALRRGVLYIEDFDDPPGNALVKPQAAAEVTAPSFSAADLAAARQSSYAEGVREGQAMAAQERSHATRLLLDSLDQKLAQAEQGFKADAEEVAAQLAQTLLAAMCGSLPDLCRSHGSSEIRALIRRIMPGLASEPRLAIRVHPGLVDEVREELSQLSQELPEKLDVTGDPAMEFTDLQARWKHGHLVRSCRQIWQELREELAINGLLPASAIPEVPHAG